MTLQYELDRYVKDHQDEWYKEGIQEGIQKGIQEGKTETQANLVRSMFANGISIEQISIIAKISIEEVKEILSANE